MKRRASTELSVAAVAVSLALAGCGGSGSQRQDENEPSGNFPVAITSATWQGSQHLSQHTHLVIKVRNTGHRMIPNLAITICNVSCATPAQAGQGTGSQAFAENAAQPGLANPSRPVWIVDRPPGRCSYSCSSGGPGAYVTAYTNTWASGGLPPGATVTFNWGLTAVVPGRHVIYYQIAAGLNGKAKAVLADGSRPGGTFAVTISPKPLQAFVNNGGQVVTGRNR